MIKISVVIPLYNKEKEIVDTINSILAQTYQADEIIVVDDGSTDNSVNVVKKMSNKIKIIRQENRGVSAARNKGLLKANNEYICLLDGDDLWEVGFLDEIKSLIQLFPEAIFYSTAHKIINESSQLINKQISSHKAYRRIIKDFAKQFSKNYALVNSSSVCIRKSTKIVFPVDEKKGEDLCVWLELSLKGSLAFSSKPLSIYKLDASNRSATLHTKAMIPCPIKWFYKNKKTLQEYRYYNSIKKFIYSNIFITVYGGFALEKNYVSINAVIKLMKDNNDYFYILLFPSYLLPIRLLNIIKIMRRKLR